MKTARFALVLALALTLAGGVGGSQSLDNDHPVYVTCTLGDTIRSVLYLSGTFRGHSDQRLDYESRFRSMLRETFPGVYGTVSCSMWTTELQAERETAAELRRISGMYRRTIPTGWVY